MFSVFLFLFACYFVLDFVICVRLFAWPGKGALVTDNTETENSAEEVKQTKQKAREKKGTEQNRN